jgi:hypothetical protein
MRDPQDQPDLFAPPPREPRIGDCLYCWGERLCEDMDRCFPPDQPEERRL